MALTPLQKEQLNNRIINGQTGANQIVDFINRNIINYPDDIIEGLEQRPDLRAAIEQVLADRPNPQEVKEWNEILAANSDTIERRIELLSTYVRHWKNINNAPDNHVDEAEKTLRELQSQLEKNSWDNVNLLDDENIYSYVKMYPYTSHAQEIDDALFALIQQNHNFEEMCRQAKKYMKESPAQTHFHEIDSALFSLISKCVAPEDKYNQAKCYIREFYNGAYVNDAQQIIDAYEDWQRIAFARNIFDVHTYLLAHPDSPFAKDAKNLLDILKHEEINQMKVKEATYSIERLIELRKREIIADHELIMHKIASQRVLARIDNYDQLRGNLPDLDIIMAECEQVCPEGRTDVYLFGIPSTGKSCVLMGLLGSPNIKPNFVRGGGDYAAALQQYLDVGVTIPRTPQNFTTTILADINGDKQEAVHQINLIEMAGENFAFNLANNPDHEVSLADMGEGVPELLANDNHKVFFLIVDPTQTIVSISRSIPVTDAMGNVTYKQYESTIHQRITLQKMVNLLEDETNEEIMKKVDALHVIVTKADTLDGVNGNSREEKALDKFKINYRQIVDPLIKLCRKYGINRATDGKPMLFTFSLGKFYVGNIYDYDETDANTLIDIIKGNTGALRPRNFWNKLQDIMNKQVI